MGRPSRSLSASNGTIGVYASSSARSDRINIAMSIISITVEHTRPSITAFFPAYNDGGTIGSLVVTTLHTLAELTDDYEVIVVENGSTDYTVDVLEELAQQYDRLHIFTHREALGYGGALRV